jgi:hypothetical protein
MIGLFCLHGQANNRSTERKPHKRLFKSLHLPIDSSIYNSINMVNFIKKHINVHTWLILCMAFVYGGLMGNFFTLMNQYLRSRVTSDFVYQVEIIYKLFILSFLIPRCIGLCYCCKETNTWSNNSNSSSSGMSSSKKAFIWIIRKNFKIYLIAFKLTILTAYQFSSSHFKDNFKLILMSSQDKFISLDVSLKYTLN